jgi:NuA3 HAT complex component NTO1
MRSSFDDIRCAICRDGNYSDNDHIVLCDGCNIAVHQSCYGIPAVPEGSYYCDKCTAQLTDAEVCVVERECVCVVVTDGFAVYKVQCILCPYRGGPVKPTIDGRWCHALCAKWMPEVYAVDKTVMRPLCGFEGIPKDRWRVVCWACQCESSVDCTMILLTHGLVDCTGMRIV